MFEASFLFELNDQLTLVLWRFGLDHVVIVAPKEFDRMEWNVLTWGSIRRTRRTRPGRSCGTPSCTFCMPG